MTSGKTAVAKKDAAISYDLESDLYDPNDRKAVEAFWRTATIKRGRGRPASDVKRPTLNMRVDADVLDAFKATSGFERVQHHWPWMANPYQCRFT